MREYYKGKLLILRITATIFVLLFLTLPYYSSIPNEVSILLLIITILIFFVLEDLLGKSKKTK